MGGTSSTEQQTSSSTQPWQPAQSSLTGILGQLGGINSGLSPTQSGAISGLLGNSGFLNQFTPQATGITNNLLSGGGANNQAGTINNAYSQYQSQLNPYASGANLNPYSTPGFSDAMNTLNSDITNQVNGQFAAAGRDMSGMNAQTLARGLSQGEGGLIQGQYNQNVQNQLGAAGSLYGAGNTTGGLLSGLNQQGLANQQAGLGAATTAQQFSNDPYMQQLNAASLQTGIPLSILQQMTGIAAPIAGLGSQSTGTSTGTNTMSGAQQFGTIAGGLGSLFSGAGNAYRASDERVKENKAKIGQLYDGTPVYSYNYIGDPTPQIGLMAQDVERRYPDAVIEVGGIKLVDYGKATENARRMRKAA